MRSKIISLTNQVKWEFQGFKEDITLSSVTLSTTQVVCVLKEQKAHNL